MTADKLKAFTFLLHSSARLKKELSKTCAAIWQRVYYRAILRMLRYVHMMICVTCTVLHGRYCVIQHSCCNTNKTIIIIIKRELL